MHVVVLVNGREAIPVRAIPLVAPVPYGVRYLVEGLMCCDRSNAMHGLTAYQWSPGAKQPLAVPPTQWMQVDSRLRALKASEVVNFSFQHCHRGSGLPMSRGREQFCGGVESEAADSPVRLCTLILGFLNPLRTQAKIT
ncbi:hypothetical protein [Accumulibacter sp.]|uniref:hypothetical protein n=1 Tax=Accumulibacter sp. TaxID=2053492 RepID=UPI00260D4954|nr:hypothetical protein [Accumulibacter sp.]